MKANVQIEGSQRIHATNYTITIRSFIIIRITIDASLSNQCLTSNTVYYRLFKIHVLLFEQFTFGVDCLELSSLIWGCFRAPTALQHVVQPIQPFILTRTAQNKIRAPTYLNRPWIKT